jgi:hypothetical protein
MQLPCLYTSLLSVMLAGGLQPGLVTALVMAGGLLAGSQPRSLGLLPGLLLRVSLGLLPSLSLEVSPGMSSVMS